MQAISLGCDSFIVYDSRAAVHEKLGNNKAALIDAKKVVDTAPDRWQGYARSARLFHALNKDEAAIKMIDLALERIKPDDAQRLQELNTLKSQATDALTAADERRRARIAKTAYHIGKLPVEIFAEILGIVVAADHAHILKLSHVCKHWRGIAIKTPLLWQTLVVSKHRPTIKVQLWMERARAHILHLSFHHNIPEMDWPSILSELSSLSWCGLRSLAASGSLFSRLYDLLHQLSKTEAISRLEHLDISGCPGFERFLPDFEDSHLDTLKVANFTPSMGGLWSRVHRLKTMTIEAGWIKILPALTANQSLENLVLSNLVPIPMQSGGDDRAELSNLQCLKLFNIASVSSITRVIVAPNLRVLHLFNIGHSSDVLEFAHADPLRALRELRVGSCTTTASSLITLIAGAPVLETLQISGIHGVVNDVLDFICGTHLNDQQQDVCTVLKHVDLSSCGDLLTRNAYSLVKTRLRTYQPVTVDGVQPGCRAEIESLRLDGCPLMEAEMLPWFRGKVRVFSCVYMTKKEGKQRR
jgi:F-box/TPR repeat protein Pof3